VYDFTERASIKPSYTEAIGTHWTLETHCGSPHFTITHRDMLSLTVTSLSYASSTFGAYRNHWVTSWR